jgi:hypothetical protein
MSMSISMSIAIRVHAPTSYKMVPFAQLALAELRRAARAKKGSAATVESAKVPAEVKKWKAALAKAKLPQVGVSLQAGLLTFSGISPDLVKRVGAVLGKG